MKAPSEKNLRQINTKEHNVEKYIQWELRRCRSSKIIGYSANRKRIGLCNFLLATNSNFGRILYYRFRHIDAICSKIGLPVACFPTPPLFVP